MQVNKQYILFSEFKKNRIIVMIPGDIFEHIS